MSEYITIRDAERRIADLIGQQTRGRCPTWDEVHEALYADLPSIFLVRCKDCKANWWVNESNGKIVCKYGRGENDPDWFCADGEEK